MPTEDFQRARRPEQVAERQTAIVRAARELLAERRLAEISLRDLSARVGLAKSNVLRYFESREAIFLGLLDAEWRAWLDELDAAPPGPAGQAAVADTLTASLVRRPLLCELFSTLAGVLEHNISTGTARSFKLSATGHTLRLCEWLTERLPGLSADAAREYAGAVAVIVGGLWGYERPSENVAQLAAEFGGIAGAGFQANLGRGLRTYLAGVLALQEPR